MNKAHLSALTWATLLLGCQPPGTDRPHTALGPNAEELRAAFNRDSGMVRVVMLASPT